MSDVVWVLISPGILPLAALPARGTATSPFAQRHHWPPTDPEGIYASFLAENPCHTMPLSGRTRVQRFKCWERNGEIHFYFVMRILLGTNLDSPTALDGIGRIHHFCDHMPLANPSGRPAV